MKPKYTNEVLSRISEIVAASMGLHFPVERLETLSRNLKAAAHEFGFHNNDEFFYWLLTNTLNKDQIETISSYLIIGTSDNSSPSTKNLSLIITIKSIISSSSKTLIKAIL